MLAKIDVSPCRQGYFTVALDILLETMLTNNADQYNIPALKRLAADDINSKLGPDNIFEELFGTFTSL